MADNLQDAAKQELLRRSARKELARRELAKRGKLSAAPTVAGGQTPEAKPSWGSTLSNAGMAAGETVYNTLRNLAKNNPMNFGFDRLAGAIAGVPNPVDQAYPESQKYGQRAAEARGKQTLGQNIVAGGVQAIPYFASKFAAPAIIGSQIMEHPEDIKGMVGSIGTSFRDALTSIPTLPNGSPNPFYDPQRVPEATERWRQQPLENLINIGLPFGMPSLIKKLKGGRYGSETQGRVVRGVGTGEESGRPVSIEGTGGETPTASGVVQTQGQVKPLNLERRGAVEIALQRGLPLPEEVLVEYPDLVAKYKKPSKPSRVIPVEGTNLPSTMEGIPRLESIVSKERTLTPDEIPFKQAADAVGAEYSGPMEFPSGKKVYGVTLVDKVGEESTIYARTPEEVAPKIEEKRAQYKAADEAKKVGWATPEQNTSIQNVMTALKEAKPLRGKQEKLYTQERGKRLGSALSIGQNIRGEKGFYAELGQLKGELPKIDFESIRQKIGQNDIDNLFNTVKDTPLIGEWEKFSAREGLAKMFGEFGGKVPTESELKLLNTVFGNDFVKTLLGKRSPLERYKYWMAQGLNMPRAIMASVDMSAPLRQGLFLVGRPKQFVPAFGRMFQAFGSEAGYHNIMKSIAEHPEYELMRQSKLSLTDVGVMLTTREERFMSNWAEKIPIAGHLVRASNRAYSGFLNKLRADVFSDFVQKADKLNLDPYHNSLLTRSMADYINTATGRGSLGSLERAAVELNTFFFSPRLMASRLKLLNPVYYVKLEPFVRRQALRDLMVLGGLTTTTLTLAKMGGAKVETDMRSSDFGKIKINNTRLDIMGGFQQYLRAAAQLTTGQYISTTTGKQITLGEGYRPLTRLDIVERIIESKEAPIFSFATNILRGQDYQGRPLNIPKEIGNRFVPMVIGDAVDIAKDDPNLLPLSAFGVFGVGIQTYKPSTGTGNLKSIPLKQQPLKTIELKQP